MIYKAKLIKKEQNVPLKPNKWETFSGIKISGHLTFKQQATVLNQIRVVAFDVPQLTQASFLQKKSNVAKCFFDICNAEMA